LRIIGITGGIGSGKSTVSRILRDLGAKVIDADRIAREIVFKGGIALQELVDYFGIEILDDSGELDRKKLSEIVFTDIEKLEVLNTITHKYIIDRIYKEVDSAREEGLWDIVVVDAPIPIKSGFLDVADEIWVVSADKESRIKRVMERSGYTHDEAVNRINSQLKDEEYTRIADQVIHNEGSIEDLEKDVVKLYISTKTSR
jgi:dephospho-CoA kinase